MQLYKFSAFMAAVRAVLREVELPNKQAPQDWLESKRVFLLESPKEKVSSFYQDACLAVYVWADEVISLSDSQERLQWKPLQQRFFNTNLGGELFFKQLNELIQKFMWSDAKEEKKELIDVIVIYKLCLNAGFLGGHYQQDKEHERIKSQLSLLISKEHSLLGTSAEDTYLPVKTKSSRNRRSSSIVALGLIAITVIVSLFVFYYSELSKITLIS